jgi:DeoR/GlpR family transcriptional regulator of sugar metabolism
MVSNADERRNKSASTGTPLRLLGKMVSNADERRNYILEVLDRDQMVKVSDLSERFGVSEVSIRRDLERLEQFGLLKRVHGGAVVNARVLLQQPHASKMQRRTEEKERIGRAAAEMIGEGERLIFDSGTTVVQVARSVPGDLLNSGNLTAITASMPIVRELGPWKGVHLIVLGGIYLPDYECLVGPQTIENLRGLHADKMFLGTDGLTFSHGITTANVLEAEVDRAMAQAAKEIIVVADSSKIGVVGLTTILELAKVHKLITDAQAPLDFVSALKDQGVEVILV